MNQEDQRDRWQRQEDARLRAKLANDALSKTPDRFMRNVEVARVAVFTLGAVGAIALLVFLVVRWGQ